MLKFPKKKSVNEKTIDRNNDRKKKLDQKKLENNKSLDSFLIEK